MVIYILRARFSPLIYRSDFLQTVMDRIDASMVYEAEGDDSRDDHGKVLVELAIWSPFRHNFSSLLNIWERMGGVGLGYTRIDCGKLPFETGVLT